MNTRAFGAIILAVLGCLAKSALAIPLVPCTQAVQQGYLTINPASPSSDQQVTLTVGIGSYLPQAVSTEVLGNVINVTLVAGYLGSPSPGPICTVTNMGPFAPGSYAVNLILSDSTGWFTSPTLLASSSLIVAPASLGELSGIWWNSSEPGWGINFTQRGSVVVAAWYTYDATGHPKWYVASNCAFVSLNPAANSGTCQGALYQVSGPSFFGVSFNPQMVNVATAGSISVSFQDANNGSFTYSVGGQTRTVAITREPVGVGSTVAPIDYTDLWWNPSESGWGIAVAQQFGNIFLAWYVYQSNGQPTWYVASNCALSGSSCTGSVYATTGPAFGSTFDASQVHVSTVGTVTVNFTDANNAVLSYTVNGVTGTKSITRQLF